MEKKIVEIGGIKMEIDFRHATKVESFKVGDLVKVLIKSYGDQYTSHAGMIAGFDNFNSLPTIVVAYLDTGYSQTPLKFAFINAKSESIEICPMVDDYMAFEESTITEAFNREIIKKKQELQDLEAKHAYFTNNFGKYFGGK